MKVVCIDNHSYENKLIIACEYVVDVNWFSKEGSEFYRIALDEDHYICDFYKHRFLSVKEYRKLKLERINSL